MSAASASTGGSVSAPTSTTSPAVPVETLEDKLIRAAGEVSPVVGIFSSAAAEAINLGAAAEPTISGIVRLFLQLLPHHAKAAKR